MGRFTTRVTLHNADSEDYENLHEAMENNGFSRTIIGNDGVEYQLPDAEYNKEGDYTIEQVRESAKNAAVTTGKRYSILVSGLDSRAWFGLERV